MSMQWIQERWKAVWAFLGANAAQMVQFTEAGDILFLLSHVTAKEPIAALVVAILVERFSNKQPTS